ncbi:hypothetical protein IJ843_05235 [bacterium]|nr:hypothetical protein [bacterium]
MTIYKFNELEIDSDTLTRDDMPTEIFEEVFDFIGAEAAVGLLYYMPGNIIQVPTSRAMYKVERRLIKENYDGTTASIRLMSRKFRISEKQVRDILKQHKIITPSVGQESLKLFY